MNKESKHFYEFGPFRIDPEEKQLLRGQEPVPVTPKAFETLLILIRSSERVVLKDDLMKALWPDSFVEESNLTQNIFVLRKALGETAQDARYIATVPGRGYRFTEKVREVADEPAALVFESRSIQRVTVEEKPQRNLLAVSLAAVALAGVIGLLLLYVRGRQLHAGSEPASSLPSPKSRRSVAVLGFRNLSGRPDKGWLSTALSEMVSTEMAAGEKLRVISGEDIAHSKLDLPLADTDSLSRYTLARLHKNLGSDLVVLGSYTVLGEKSDGRIRLDLRLQDTVAGETVADLALVGSEADLFDLVSQAGSRLREKLGVEAVSPVEAVSVRASLPSNREAARLYSEGLARLRVFDALEARDLLQRAVAADLKYPLAHSALAEAWFRLGYEKKAQREARQGYELAANLSREDRLVVEGRCREVDHQYEKAIDAYRALFTLFPDNIDYGLRLAAVESRGSKAHDALATIESLHKLAPPASEDPRLDLQEVAAWNALSDFKHQEQPLARAVEKARAQGARLVLADARKKQCWLFSYFEQLQNAIAACRESKDIYAAAGDGEGEAESLRAWADAIAQADVPESIRLYQQAQTIFRTVGSERGVATVLNNLGLVYEAEGDLITAEKMHREALASFRRLDDKKREAAAIQNVANERMEQGDLRGAILLYEGALQIDREIEDTGNAAIAGYNIANLRQLQGDLASAKEGFEQSLATWQKNGDQYSSTYALWSLGSLLVQEADFSGARKMYEQALALRTSAGDKLSIAETQLGLADLSLEEARSPVEQEAAMRQVIEVFQKEKARDDEAHAWSILARTMLAEGKGAAAEEAAQRARVLAAKSQNPEIRWRTAIAAVRIETAGKDIAHSASGTAALNELAPIIAKSRDLGYQGIELDARLALAEIEMKAGQLAAGRAHLVAIAADAKAKGYNLVARKATIARG
jgi:DNA-binding winged helix-turn-helix (wHTH) protein/tetratricopeptide (TPR) repeat protein